MRVESSTPQVNLAELEFEFATFRGRIACLSSEACDHFTSLVMFDELAEDTAEEVIDIALIERSLDFDNLTDVESFLMA